MHIRMQTMIPAAVAVASSRSPWLKAPWVKTTARVAFTLLFIKGTAWVAMSWLALRGFGSF